MAVVDVCHSQRRHDKICAAPSRNNFVTRWRMKRLFGHQSKLIVSKHEQYSSEKKLSSRVSGSQAPPLQKGKLGMTFQRRRVWIFTSCLFSGPNVHEAKSVARQT
jgi:hypothetical protein